MRAAFPFKKGLRKEIFKSHFPIALLHEVYGIYKWRLNLLYGLEAINLVRVIQLCHWPGALFVIVTNIVAHIIVSGIVITIVIAASIS